MSSKDGDRTTNNHEANGADTSAAPAQSTPTKLPPQQRRELIQELLERIEQHLDQQHLQQTERALKFARYIKPNVSLEDLLNPDDFQEIMSDPAFVYEDGVSNGILSAKISVRALLRGME